MVLRNTDIVGGVVGAFVVAAALVLVVRAAVDTSAQLAAHAQELDALTGAYVETLAPDACDFRPNRDGSSGGARAAIALFAPGVLTLRSIPTNASRVLHLQKRRVPINVLRSDRRDDIARWDGADLVVKSDAPGLPLWSEPRAVAGARTLLEVLSLSTSSLTYRAVYQDENGANVGRPFQLTLRRCDTANVNGVLSSRLRLR